MTYEMTKHYVCGYCGKKQTKDEQVYTLGGHYLTMYVILGTPIKDRKIRYACKTCIDKGLVPGYSNGK